MTVSAPFFALANPDPEVDPAEADKYAAVVASGRSDYLNQINNVLAFPGVFRGLLDARASEITVDMLLRAAEAIALVVKDDELNPNFIIPTVFHPDVPKAVAAAIRGRRLLTGHTAGHAQLRAHRDHRRAPGAVFAILDDSSRTPEWLLACTGIDKLTDGPTRSAPELRYHYRDAAGRPMDGEIARHEPGAAPDHALPRQMTDVTVDFRTAPRAPETSLTHEIAIAPKGIGKLFTPMIKRSLPKQTLDAMPRAEGARGVRGLTPHRAGVERGADDPGLVEQRRGHDLGVDVEQRQELRRPSC